MTYVKVKCQSRSNVVKNVLLLPTLARRITKQVKDDDDLYEGQRSTEVISGQGMCHRDDTVMSIFFCLTLDFQCDFQCHSFIVIEHGTTSHFRTVNRNFLLFSIWDTYDQKHSFLVRLLTIL